MTKGDEDDARADAINRFLMTSRGTSGDLFKGDIDARLTRPPRRATHAVRSKGFRMFLCQQFVGINGRALRLRHCMKR